MRIHIERVIEQLKKKYKILSGPLSVKLLGIPCATLFVTQLCNLASCLKGNWGG